MITLQEAIAQQVATNEDGTADRDELVLAMSKLLMLLLQEHLNIGKEEEYTPKQEFVPSP